ncbi:coiled-coil domain-containing protein 77 [Chanos chanos]|uniref:Coiled-coil domain-containing protein 77 n=1 Tax=Chanos chanos TaxID=29144 RepID=A0A6J2V8N9_CHACN|nr:coiled-coil domain-containing protein 77 [Chanos chanos]
MDSPPTRDHVTESPEKQAESPLPPIQERLACLRPSRELLEFYRQKVAQFDEEHDSLLQMLEKYKSAMADQSKLQWEVRQREEEISELQRALSDMQICLLQEREQALRLYAENDRLKIRQLEDRKKIQHLLSLLGPDVGEITYFHREPPHKVSIPQKKLHSKQQENQKPQKFRLVSAREGSRRQSKDGLKDAETQKDKQTLLLQVEALQAQMEEQTRLAKEQVESLLEDRRIYLEEGQNQHQRDQEKITALTDKLQRTQNLLYESTRDFLQLKFDNRVQEKNWMTEKDELLRKLDSYQDKLREARGSHFQPSLTPSLPLTQHISEPCQAHREEIKALEEELKQAHKLADMYREQCIGLETDLTQIREEGDVGREIFKERSEKMANRLRLMTQRYEALEKRRALEVEGFKTDIKYLRQKLKDLEKQIFKVTLNVGPDQDLAILHEVRQTNAHTKKVLGELKTLKAKIYGLENELRYG